MRKKHGAQMAGPWLIPKGQGPHWHTPNIATTPPTRLSRVYHALVDFQPISHSDLSSCPVVIPKVSKKKKKTSAFCSVVWSLCRSPQVHRRHQTVFDLGSPSVQPLVVGLDFVRRTSPGNFRSFERLSP